MLAVPRLPVVAFVLALPTGAVAQGFEYAPGNAQFRVTQKTKLSQEMMGQKNDFETNAVQLFSMTLTRPSRDTLLATYVMDSVFATTPMGTPAPSLERYKGMKVEVRTTPTGTPVHSVKGPTETEVPNAGALVMALGVFLPQMRSTITTGTRWSDTTTGKVNQFGIELDRNAISRAEVLKDTTVNGAPAWKIQRTDTTTIAGNGVGQNGQPMSMEGGSLGKTTFLVTPRGMLLAADGTETGSLRVVLAATGMQITVTTSADTKVEKVK